MDLQDVTATTTTPPADLLKILILQRRDEVIQSIQNYYKMSLSGASAPSNIVLSRVRSLFF